MTVIYALALTYRIELVSILVLCILLCLLYYVRKPIARKSKPSNTKNSLFIREYEMSPSTLDNSSVVYPVSYEKISHHVTINASEDVPLISDTRKLVQRWEDLICPYIDTHSGVSENLGETLVPNDSTVRLWEPRRSERVRKPTKRFAESWYNGRLQSLRCSLGFEE